MAPTAIRATIIIHVVTIARNTGKTIGNPGGMIGAIANITDKIIARITDRVTTGVIINADMAMAAHSLQAPRSASFWAGQVGMVIHAPTTIVIHNITGLIMRRDGQTIPPIMATRSNITAILTATIMRTRDTNPTAIVAATRCINLVIGTDKLQRSAAPCAMTIAEMDMLCREADT